ncbi:MAG: SDR family oxidoreductase, partial [Planctomycetes bacterium]|nr:SDR family oxidoreductase [Planctomycetota bacterium]
MRILVAGGAGYIGSKLIPVLLEHGYKVDVVDLLWFGNHLPENVSVVKKDLFKCRPDDLKDYDQVIFLAGLSNDPMAEFDPSMNFIFNGALPSYMAYVAKRAGVRRFIYASSCSVYGYTVNELYDEDSPVTCGYPYGISKLQGERGVLQLHDKDFSVIALRQGTVCGYSPRMRLDLIVNTMFKFAFAERKITVNNPSIWRPILDIRDAATAYLRAIQADYSLSGVYNVASGNYTVGQVGDMVKYEVEKLTGEKVEIALKNIEDFRNYKVTIDKAKTYLGYQPQHTIEDIIDDLYEN